MWKIPRLIRICLLIKHVFFSLLILITLLHNPYESSGRFICATWYIQTILFWKETAFPRWRAMDRRWKRNSVSLVSSVTTVMRLPISCVTSMAVVRRRYCEQFGFIHIRWGSGENEGSLVFYKPSVPSLLDVMQLLLYSGCERLLFFFAPVLSSRGLRNYK